jgi:copper(I)-binding protein
MKRFATILVLGLAAAAAQAQVSVKEPWVRATTPKQKATGAFMRLEAGEEARLVGAASPVAGVVELHEMVQEGDVMKMRAVPAIAIPAGRGAELKPGGYHVMLMELKSQLKEGETVPITLTVESKDGRRQTLEVRAPVRALRHAPGEGAMKKHGH